MGKCLILGASGFIGKNLFRTLQDANFSVTGFSRAPRPTEISSFVNWCQGDFRTGAGLSDAIKDKDVVYHLVSSTVPASAQSDRVADIESNLIPSLRLMDLCLQHGVKRLVFVSSGGTVYGPDVPVPTREDAPTDPISAYGVTKLAIEKYLGMYTSVYGLKSTIIRLSNPYGPFQVGKNNQGVISVFMSKIRNGVPIEIWGKGDSVRDYVYIEDVCTALMLTATKTDPHNVINIGTGTGHSLLEVIDKLQVVLDKKAELIHLPSRSVDVSRSILDISKAKQALTWSPKFDLLTGIELTNDWFSGHGNS